MRHTWHARAHMVEHGISTEPTHNTTHPIARNAMGYALSSNQSWVLFSQADEKTLRTARWTPSIHSRHTYSTQRSHITHLALEFPIQHGNFVRSSCLSSAKRSPGEIGRKLEDWELRDFLRGDLDNPCSFSASFSLSMALKSATTYVFRQLPVWMGPVGDVNSNWN